MAGGVGTKEINRKWPIEDGLTAGTTKQTGHKEFLPILKKSLLSENERV